MFSIGLFDEAYELMFILLTTSRREICIVRSEDNVGVVNTNPTGQKVAE